MIRRRDIAWTIAVAAVAFAVYAATLAPGLIAITDTPKFQFVGRILGTAHPPGYPLYVMVSYLFGFLPIGSLAYRINLMSAFFGAAACGLTFLSARATGARVPVAAACALGLAFGTTFWSVSTIAEVYTLNAFFVAAIILTLLVWRRSRHPAAFFAAVALVGLASGNHITVVFMVPATALFACAVAPRFALRPKTIIWSAVIVLIALTQYLFIYVRSRQGVWGDTQVSNFSELLAAMTGSQYFGDVMPGGIHQAVERIPAVWRTFLEEQSVIGSALAVFGMFVCAWRQPSTLVLLAAALLGYAGFTATYMPHEFEVFLIPGFIVCWILAAVGVEWLVDVAGSRTRPWTAVAASAALIILPGWQLARNYAARDLRFARSDVRFFDALFEQLPERSALVHDNFLIDRMVYYKTLGEHADEQRHIEALLPAVLEPVEGASHEGRQVFAFPQTASAMRLLDAAEFSYTPFALSNGSIERYLADLPPGTMVAAGVPGIQVSGFASGGRLPLAAIGFNTILTGAAVDGFAVIGVRGATTLDGVSFPIAAPRQAETIFRGSNLTAPIVVRAEGQAASIVFGGREIVRTESGMVVAVWNRERLTAAFVVPVSTRATPTLPTPYAVYPLRAIHQRVPVSADPVDVTSALSTGQFVYTPPPGPARVVIYAGRERPLAPRLEESSSREWPAVDVRHFDGPQAANGELGQSLSADGFTQPARLLGMRHVYRMTLDTSWAYPAGVHVAIGGVPDALAARMLSGKPGSVRPIDLGSHLRRVDDRTWLLQMARDYQQQLVGYGWSPVQFDGIAGYRETVDREAELSLPLPSGRVQRIGIQMLRLPGGEDRSGGVALQINGHDLPAVMPAHEWTRYWWSISPDETIVGPNSLVIVCQSGERIAVSDLLIESVP